PVGSRGRRQRMQQVVGIRVERRQMPTEQGAGGPDQQDREAGQQSGRAQRRVHARPGRRRGFSSVLTRSAMTEATAKTMPTTRTPASSIGKSRALAAP